MNVSISKHKKRKKRTLTPTQTHNFDVQYSAINHDLIMYDHKHAVQVTEGIKKKKSIVAASLTFKGKYFQNSAQKHIYLKLCG